MGAGGGGGDRAAVAEADDPVARRTRGRGTSSFGGTLRATASVVSEIALSTLLAPITLSFQSRAVLEILFGLDGGWPATRRDGTRVSLDTAFAASWWVVAAGAGTLALTMALAPPLVPWMLPVMLPAIGAPPLIVLTSLPGGRWLFGTPLERQPSEIMLLQQQIHAAWTTGGTAPAAGVPGHVLT